MDNIADSSKQSDSSQPVGNQVDDLVASLEEKVWIAYHERSEMISLFTYLWPSHICTDDAEPDWMVVCVHTPHGQAGWHISARDKKLFKRLKAESNHYDGHTTREKYKRVWLSIKELATVSDLITEGLSQDKGYSKALIQAEIRGACDAIERFTDALVDEGAENFLDIKHRLIKQLEEKRP